MGTSMNKELQAFARTHLKKNLALCTKAQQRIFKKMYSHKDLDKDLDQVVEDMPEERLNWAMQQVQRTVDDN
jgi:hypothetical protein